MVSKAYKEGLTAGSYCENPYDKNTIQYDDFERGQTQKIKRSPCNALDSQSGPIGEEVEYHDLKGSRFLIEKSKLHMNAYADARKK